MFNTDCKLSWWLQLLQGSSVLSLALFGCFCMSCFLGQRTCFLILFVSTKFVRPSSLYNPLEKSFFTGKVDEYPDIVVKENKMIDDC